MNKHKKEDKKSQWISYFQSVLTIGVMTRASSISEAEILAKEKMKNKDGVNYCLFEQTPFELTDTDHYEPEFEAEGTKDGLAFRFNPDNQTKNIIATRLGKQVDDLDSTDLDRFVKESIDIALKGKA